MMEYVMFSNTTKVCSKCKLVLPIKEFKQYKDNKGILRYRRACMQCNKAKTSRKPSNKLHFVEWAMRGISITDY